MNSELQSDTHKACEWQAQERALQEARRGSPASGDWRIDAYRAVFQGVAQASRSEPPADFAERTLRAVREAEVDEHVERWMLRIAGSIGVLGLVVFAGPILLDTLRFSAVYAMPAAGMFASPLLWAAFAGVAAAGLMDSLQTARRETSH